MSEKFGISVLLIAFILLSAYSQPIQTLSLDGTFAGVQKNAESQTKIESILLKLMKGDIEALQDELQNELLMPFIEDLQTKNPQLGQLSRRLEEGPEPAIGRSEIRLGQMAEGLAVSRELKDALYSIIGGLTATVWPGEKILPGLKAGIVGAMLGAAIGGVVIGGITLGLWTIILAELLGSVPYLLVWGLIALSGLVPEQMALAVYVPLLVTGVIGAIGGFFVGGLLSGIMLIPRLFALGIVGAIIGFDIGYNRGIPADLRCPNMRTIMFGTDSKIHEIIYPLSSLPVIQEKGKTFTVKVNLSNPLTGKRPSVVTEWSATLSTAYDRVVKTYPLDIVSATLNSSMVWDVNARIPEDCFEDLYNLTIGARADGREINDTQPRAVSVISEFKDTFRFIHVADPHVWDPRTWSVNWKEAIDNKQMKKVVEEINLLNPDFVIFGGDEVTGNEFNFEYETFYEILQQFDVPTYLLVGNHDGVYALLLEDGYKFYEDYLGPLRYSFDYGEYHFTCINTYDWGLPDRVDVLEAFLPAKIGGQVRDEQMRWIEDDLTSHSESKLRFAVGHNSPVLNSDMLVEQQWAGSGREELLELLNRYNVSMFLAGHVHFDDVVVENGTIFAATTSCGADIRLQQPYWGYRLVEIEDGKIASYNYKEPKWSIPSYRLSCTYTKNDGTSKTVKAKIENNLEIDLENALLKFYVPKGDYEVINGTPIMERDDGNVKCVHVTANVNAGQSKVVSIMPEEDDKRLMI